MKVQCFIQDAPLLAMNGVTTRISEILLIGGRGPLLQGFCWSSYIEKRLHQFLYWDHVTLTYAKPLDPLIWLLCFLLVFVASDFSSFLLAVLNLLLFYESELLLECTEIKKTTKFIFVIVRANIALLVFRGGVSFSKPTPNHQTTPTCRSLFEIYQLTAVSHIWTSHLFHPQIADSNLGLVGGRWNWGGVNLHGLSQVQGF